MMWAEQFVELNKSTHDRESFECGENELNIFIRQFAAKHMQAGISRTMVLPATMLLPNNKLPICSFYTVAAYSGAIRTPIPALPGQSFRDKPDTDSAINQPF